MKKTNRDVKLLAVFFALLFGLIAAVIVTIRSDKNAHNAYIKSLSEEMYDRQSETREIMEILRY